MFLSVNVFENWKLLGDQESMDDPLSDRRMHSNESNEWDEMKQHEISNETTWQFNEIKWNKGKQHELKWNVMVGKDIMDYGMNVTPRDTDLWRLLHIIVAGCMHLLTSQ